MKEAIKILVEFSLLYKTLMMVEMRSKIFIAKGGILTIVVILSMTKAIDNRKLCLTSFLFLFL